MAFPQRLHTYMVLFVGILFTKGGESQIQCVQTDTCTCQFNDQTKTVVNFGTIGLRNGKPKFPFGSYGMTGDFLYSFNPCYAFSAESCNDVVSCQQFTKDSPPSYFDLGNPDPVSWTTSNDGVILVTYSDGEETNVRTTSVSYTCDATALDPTLQVISEAPTRQYNMVIKTCAACSPAVPECPTKVPGAPGGITGGGIICIIFTVLVVVYIIGGILFQKFARGATGKELIPNYNFWSDFPVLVKDGFLFMLSPCKRGGYTDMSK